MIPGFYAIKCKFTHIYARYACYAPKHLTLPRHKSASKIIIVQCYDNYAVLEQLRRYLRITHVTHDFRRFRVRFFWSCSCWPGRHWARTCFWRGSWGLKGISWHWTRPSFRRGSCGLKGARLWARRLEWSGIWWHSALHLHLPRKPAFTPTLEPLDFASP